MSLLLLIILGSIGWVFLQRLFPGVPHQSPECGGGGDGDDSKESRRQEDIARQREAAQNTQNQFLAQLIPGSPEHAQFQSESARLISGISGPEDEEALVRDLGTRLVQQQQARITAGGPATALEARTGLQVGALRQAVGTPSAGGGARPEETDLFRVLRGEEPTTALGRIFRDQIIRPSEGGGLEEELARALRGEPTTTHLGASAQRQVALAGEQPDLAFEQELSLLQDQINRQAAQRGLATSGLPIEQLGRAGGELAVRRAQEREGIRRQREQDVLNLLDTVQSGQQTRLQNVGTLQQLSQQLRGREIGLEEAVTNLQSGRESRLTNLLQSQTGTATENLLRLLQRETEQSIAGRLDAEDAEAARRKELGGVIGTGLAVAAAPFTGGASLAFAPAAQQIGQGLAGGGSPQTSTLASLLGQQQAAGAQGLTSPAGGLSRRRTLSDDDVAELVKALRQTQSS